MREWPRSWCKWVASTDTLTATRDVSIAGLGSSGSEDSKWIIKALVGYRKYVTRRAVGYMRATVSSTPSTRILHFANIIVSITRMIVTFSHVFLFREMSAYEYSGSVEFSFGEYVAVASDETNLLQLNVNLGNPQDSPPSTFGDIDPGAEHPPSPGTVSLRRYLPELNGYTLGIIAAAAMLLFAAFMYTFPSRRKEFVYVGYHVAVKPVILGLLRITGQLEPESLCTVESICSDERRNADGIHPKWHWVKPSEMKNVSDHLFRTKNVRKPQQSLVYYLRSTPPSRTHHATSRAAAPHRTKKSRRGNFHVTFADEKKTLVKSKSTCAEEQQPEQHSTLVENACDNSSSHGLLSS